MAKSKRRVIHRWGKLGSTRRALQERHEEELKKATVTVSAKRALKPQTRKALMDVAQAVIRTADLMPKTEGLPESIPFASGGERSQLAPRFDLIPREFLECLADRLALGLRQHGEREILSVYRRSDETGRQIILMDEHWWTEMLNHLQDHVISLRDKDYQEDDLWGHAGAVMWNAGMIAWLDRKRKELRKEVFDAARQK